ncbi:MAG: GNAT family N-acetyltransferase [Bacilli bacterium]|nr:GNAT family N-acetyltransferase [Bacilli bacterium]MDD4076623.1 GNAT family N-acetyltransferase [Bacilli bacterium]MDD4388164.1 GNAT family N-acetyltransferase [Bacilli bacterium]
MKTLETKRMILRLWQEADLADLYEYAKEDNVGVNAGWPKHESIEQSKIILDRFISEKDVYAIVYKDNGKVIGSIGVHNRPNSDLNKTQREIGYVLSKSYWNQGLMTEAVREVIRYVFRNMRIDILWCAHFDFNLRSKRVIEKCGFKYYKEEKREAKLIGKTYRTLLYILEKEDYIDIDYLQ